MLARPSRSYLDVQHDPNGISGVGSRPYSPNPRQDTFKTYRPPLSETHLKRPVLHDPHPTSSFSPLPQFHLSSKSRKDQIAAGQRAEVDHLLAPAYRSSAASILSDDSSITGTSKKNGLRTAGGLGFGVRKDGTGMRHSASTSSFSQPLHSAGSGGSSGIYIDANGKAHDTEFDPFAGVAKMSRRKSRRSAFGADRRKGSDSSSSSRSSSDDESGGRSKPFGTKVSFDGDGEQEEIRRRLDMERRRLDEVSGYAAARRRSMISERDSGINGRTTPSIRSSEDGLNSSHSLNFDRAGNRSRSSQGYYIRSPLSPTFGQSPSPPLPPTAENESSELAPRKETEFVKAEVKPKPVPLPKVKVEKSSNGTTKITGFDAPSTPLLQTSSTMSTHSHSLAIPESQLNTGRNSPNPRRSIESTRTTTTTTPRAKPAERPRDQSFPETPAQIKKREEKERRTGRNHIGNGRPPLSLAVDTTRERVLPEIEIVEDDDPRIIFPSHGATTRIQTNHDHVIRGPFSLALHAGGGGTVSGGSVHDLGRPSSMRSYDGSGNKAPSTIIDEGPGGYLPSRWASGDRKLRLTEDDKEMYRPREWGGKKGELGGKPEEWKPDMKETVKKQWKEIATATRFSLFRTKKKLSRKVDI